MNIPDCLKINPLDAYSVNTNSGTSFTSNNLITTAANDLLYGIEIDSGTGTALSGWTTRSTLNNNVAADKNAPTAGTYSFTGTSIGSFIAWIAAFKQAGAIVPDTTPPPTDTTAPSVPTNLSATAVSSSQINLSWTVSSDNVGVIGYKIYRSGTQIGVAVNTSYSDTNLSRNTNYSYRVSAYDAVGNNSAKSTSTSVKTYKFALNDRIKTSGSVNVRTTPSTQGVLLGAQPINIMGTIIDGPVRANGYWWWNVNFDSGPDGWVIQNRLTLLFSAAIVPIQNILSLGMQDDEVFNLQEFLSKLNSNIYPEGLITGYYGPFTTKAVQNFQCKYGIICEGNSDTTGHGRVGPKTRLKINEMMAGVGAAF